MTSAKLSILLALCVSIGAYADGITGISPSRIPVGSIEEFVTIRGAGLVGTESTVITWTGPAGQFSLEPVVASEDGTMLIAFVPVEVGVTEGQYSVDVYATDIGSAPRHLGPAGFVVFQQVIVAAPLLSVPEVFVVEATGPSGATVNYPVSAVSQGGTGLTVTCSPASGSVFPLGTRSVSCTATDSAGSTSEGFLVVVTDTLPPILTLPANITTTNPVVTFTATAVDALDGAVPVSCSPASGSTFPLGVTTVECVAEDAHLNPKYGSFLVTVVGGPPVLSLPADMTAEATGPAGAVVSYVVTATNEGVVSCTPPSGSTFALGSTTVNCTATNDAGSVSGSFRVTVVDTTAPALVLPANITAEATSPAGAQVTFTPTATDLVDGSVAVICTPPSGSTFALGSTTVSCSASDTRANTAYGSFTVRVVDTTPPVVTSITTNPGSLWPPDHKMIATTVTVVATDAVDPNPVSQIVSVSSNQPVNGTGDGDMAPDWRITGPLTLELRAERAGNQDRIYTITVSTTDASGNSVLSTVQVKVVQSSRGRAVR